MFVVIIRAIRSLVAKTGATKERQIGSLGSDRKKEMHELKYLAGYSEKITGQVKLLISENRLGSFLLKKYPYLYLKGSGGKTQGKK
jgi:hypothetical protein